MYAYEVLTNPHPPNIFPFANLHKILYHNIYHNISMSAWSENVESLRKNHCARQNIEKVTEFVIL